MSGVSLIGGYSYGIQLTIMEDRILLQLNPKEEPAWLYFDAQHRHITDRLRSVYNTQQKKVLGMCLLLSLYISCLVPTTQHIIRSHPTSFRE